MSQKTELLARAIYLQRRNTPPEIFDWSMAEYLKETHEAVSLRNKVLSGDPVEINETGLIVVSQNFLTMIKRRRDNWVSVASGSIMINIILLVLMGFILQFK